MSKKLKKSPSSLRSGESHTLRLAVTATSSPVGFVGEFARSGEEPGLDLVADNLGPPGVDKGMEVGVIALESSEEGMHSCLMTLIRRDLYRRIP